MTVDPALGTPLERVTHWGISRILGWRRNEKQKRTPVYERVTHPRPDGVHLNEWPIAECTLENIRARWGAGEYRCHFFCIDPEALEPADRKSSGGNGPIFQLDEPEAEESTAAPVAALPPPPDTHVGSQLDFAIRMMELSDRRAQASIAQIAAMAEKRDGGAGSAEILAQLAEMRATLAAEKAQRELEDRHRAELAKKDEEIRELKRAKEKAEEDAEKSDAPSFDPDVSIWDQIPVVAINGVMSLAKTHPEIAMGIIEKGAAMWEKRKADAAAVPRETGAPPPPAMRAPAAVVQPRPAIHVVPPPPVARRVDDPLTPTQTARAADPPPPPPKPVIDVQAAPAE